MAVSLKRHKEILLQYLKPQKARVGFLSTTLFIGTLLQLIEPQILRHFIDTATRGGTPRALTITAVVFMAAAVTHQILSVITTYLSENVSWTATNALREDLTRHCLGLDLSFHKKRTPGEMIQRLDGDVAILGNFFSQFVVGMLSNLLLMGGILIALTREDYRVGLILALFAAGVLFLLNKLRKFAVPYWIASYQANAELYGFLEERLAGTEDIRACGATDYVMLRLYERLRSLFRKFLKGHMMGAGLGIVTAFGFILAFSLGLGMGAWLYQHHAITLGTVFLILHYTSILQGPMQSITRQVGYFQQSSASVERIEELLQTTNKIIEGPGIVLPKQALSVEFDDVSFGYETDLPVLQDVSFRLEAGKVLGLLGRTGSGKSTLSRLLFRLYDPESGTIRLAENDILQARVEDLRQQISMVTQDVQLFNASLRDNLTFFDKSISEARLLVALEELGLVEWVQSLPQGLDTILQSGGTGFSAGEAQLLAFARAFLKNPGLVILDEASSRLDPATEQLIERAVGRLLHDRTGIIIAHRLQTVFRADEIMILEVGRICEYGSRPHLAADSGSRFYGLLQTGLEEALA